MREAIEFVRWVLALATVFLRTDVSATEISGKRGNYAQSRKYWFPQ
jgi:hypothetical protein